MESSPLCPPICPEPSPPGKRQKRGLAPGGLWVPVCIGAAELFLPPTHRGPGKPAAGKENRDAKCGELD